MSGKKEAAVGCSLMSAGTCAEGRCAGGQSLELWRQLHGRVGWGVQGEAKPLALADRDKYSTQLPSCGKDHLTALQCKQA